MNYKQLKNLAESKKIMLKEIAETLGMTPNGFKVSIETEKFPIGKVKELCLMLEITAAEFFDETSSQVNNGSITGQMVVGNGHMTMGDASEVIFLRQQIKEKDRQIAELLTVIRNINTSKICKYGSK